MTLPTRLRAVLLAAAAGAAGAATGVASVAVHHRVWGPPLLALASLAGLLALPSRWSTRVPFALGWSLVVLLAVQGRPEGDMPVNADAAGWLLALLAGALPVLAVVTAWWAGRRSAPRPPRRATGRGPITRRRGSAT